MKEYQVTKRRMDESEDTHTYLGSLKKLINQSVKEITYVSENFNDQDSIHGVDIRFYLGDGDCVKISIENC